ncbi:Protein-lysine N-methyltransferase efm5 [Exophiala xenobiotica]|uniref:Protein-lysine N-methyltransferase efm5 n=1 Tax=Lithohypha guttulata TaxID=1690604 RepID=A0ABR0JUT9_9EURO|nr:Protein-lysine N-methyltransferase efm5 [Lithohypha guttulata]KAK5309075.1 Protein-lysine N-methyltransferase efm5 [Exophiala xenobiotica]
MISYDDDIPVLSGNTLAALQDFYNMRNKDQDAFEQLRSFTSHGDKSEILSISMFKEDWNASQFWAS